MKRKKHAATPYPFIEWSHLADWRKEDSILLLAQMEAWREKEEYHYLTKKHEKK